MLHSQRGVLPKRASERAGINNSTPSMEELLVFLKKRERIMIAKEGLETEKQNPSAGGAENLRRLWWFILTGPAPVIAH